MAKKGTTKKSAKKAAAKATGKKSAKKTAKKSAKKAGPVAVTTGKGATPAELGAALLAHVRSGAHDDMPLWKAHFHKNFTSIEGSGQAWTGTKSVQAKCEAWMGEHIVHSAKATGPFVGATGFSVVYDMDVEHKPTGNLFQMQEVGVYTVKKGKIVQEEFMYGGM
jgi:hypothetical protein